MFSNSILESTKDLSDNNEQSSTNEAMINDAKESSPEIEMTDDDDVAQELRDDSSLRDEAEKGIPSPANNSILGDFTLFRDFFLAAFSDGCYKVSFLFSAGSDKIHWTNQHFVLAKCTRLLAVDLRDCFQAVACHSAELESYRIRTHSEMAVNVERLNQCIRPTSV